MRSRFQITILVLMIALPGFSQSWQPNAEREKRLVQSIGFSPDGKILYFSLMQREYLAAQGMEVPEQTPLLAIYQADWEENGWGEPYILPFSGEFKDYEPTLSPDGTRLYFNSHRPMEGKEVGELNNIWYSDMVNGQWSAARPVEGINTIENEESYPTVTAGGKLYFLAGRSKNGKMTYGLYSINVEEPGAKMVEEAFLNRQKGSADPWVSADETYIIFTKFDMDIGWAETCDLYISFREGDQWAEPQPMTMLNSDGPDYAVAISPDEKWIYYRKNSAFIRLAWRPLLKDLSEGSGG